MSIELVCDCCGKRLKKYPGVVVPSYSWEWAEIEVRLPQKEPVGGLVIAPLSPRYTLCSTECAHKILDRISKELDDAFKSITSPGT